MARRKLEFASLVFALALASCVSPEELRREELSMKRLLQFKLRH
jgi:hypothetical protein